MQSCVRKESCISSEKQSSFFVNKPNSFRSSIANWTKTRMLQRNYSEASFPKAAKQACWISRKVILPRDFLNKWKQCFLKQVAYSSPTYQLHMSDRGLGHILEPLRSMGTVWCCTALYNDTQGSGFDLTEGGTVSYCASERGGKTLKASRKGKSEEMICVFDKLILEVFLDAKFGWKLSTM